MGQTFGKCVKTDTVDDRSGVSKQSTPAPSNAHRSLVRNESDEDLFWKWRSCQDVSCEEDEEIDLFWKWRSCQDVSCEGDEEIDLFWTWRTGQGERDEASDVVADGFTTQDPVPSKSLVHVHFGLDSNDNAVQNPVPDVSDWEEEMKLDWDKEIQPASVYVAEEEMEDDEKPTVDIREINSCLYEIGDILAEGSCGVTYEATRVKDGLKVAIKYVSTTKHMDYISIPGYLEPLPREVALHLLACEGKFIPEIIQLLDWQVCPDYYVTVLEYPSPCMDLLDFTASKGGKLNEDLAKDIMWQATMAADTCCQRGVFHRDIKMENLLITSDTLYVKLVDFGCGDILKSSTYKTFVGTRDYTCPEFFQTGEYYAKPANVYSLGVLLFSMLCGKFPNCNDLYLINERIWYKDGLSEECCDLIEACLQEDPEKRVNLEKILCHKWFQQEGPAGGLQTPINSDDVTEDPDDAGSDFNDGGEVLIQQASAGSVSGVVNLHTSVSVASYREGKIQKNLRHSALYGEVLPFLFSNVADEDVAVLNTFFSRDSDREDQFLHKSFKQPGENLMHNGKTGVFILEINCCQYAIGKKLGHGGFGSVYEGTRVRDGLKVAVKYVTKTEDVINAYIKIPGHPEPLPREVALQMLACKGRKVPLIIEFLDWQEHFDYYLMVLERPFPCEDVCRFVDRKGGSITEDIAQVILKQVTKASEICFQRGVFHRDIKMENLIINPNTLEVKIIDFGCGDLFKQSAYSGYMGTKVYACPEYCQTHNYHGKPATVYSLGILLFVMVCRNFPNSSDMDLINNKIWNKDGLSEECCDLIQACLQENPEERMCLEKMLHHTWFQVQF